MVFMRISIPILPYIAFAAGVVNSYGLPESCPTSGARKFLFCIGSRSLRLGQQENKDTCLEKDHHRLEGVGERDERII